MTATSLFCCGLLFGQIAAPSATPLHAGNSFRDAFRRTTITASWRSVGLRVIARRIESDQRIAVLIDRRIDPSRELTVDITEKTMAQALRQVAKAAEGSATIVGNVVYIGPQQAAARLRTLVQLRTTELQTIGGKRILALSKTRTTTWSDLATPAEILQKLAGNSSLSVDGLDSIPHDLWGAATLPSMTTTESLSLLLVQFDRTFVWTNGGSGVRLVPIPEDVSIEKTYTLPRGLSVTDAITRLKQQVPKLRTSVRDGMLVVRGTVEEQDAVSHVLAGKSATLGKTKPKTKPAELANRRFTLKIAKVPAIALIRKLQSSGIRIEYDARALAAEKVDLNRPISMDVKQATADEFFGVLCKQLSLAFTINGSTVTLRAK
jgi:hypothetical protein